MIRTPRLTFVSDGKPLRRLLIGRLLIGSKAVVFVVVVLEFVSHRSLLLKWFMFRKQ